MRGRRAGVSSLTRVRRRRRRRRPSSSPVTLTGRGKNNPVAAEAQRSWGRPCTGTHFDNCSSRRRFKNSSFRPLCEWQSTLDTTGVGVRCHHWHSRAASKQCERTKESGGVSVSQGARASGHCGAAATTHSTTKRNHRTAAHFLHEGRKLQQTPPLPPPPPPRLATMPLLLALLPACSRLSFVSRRRQR
jgi:hypothetical protein